MQVLYKHLHTSTQQRRVLVARQYENSVLCLCMKLKKVTPTPGLLLTPERHHLFCLGDVSGNNYP